MVTFFRRTVFLPCLVLAIIGLMVCCGCGGDPQTATSTTDNVASQAAASRTPGPPPPPVTGGQNYGSTVANVRSGGTGSVPPGPQLNLPAGAPASPYGGATPTADPSGALANNDPGRDVPPAADRVLDGPPVAGFEIGNIAPEIEGDDLEGEPFRLSDYRGKVVVVDFWGDW